MKRVVLPFFFLFAVAFFSCGGQSKQVVSNDGDNTADRRPVVEGMTLNGPVKTMTKQVYTANRWEETRYEFDEDGRLTAVVPGNTTDDTLPVEKQGADGTSQTRTYTGDYSEATDDYYISAVFNDQGVMTRYHLNDGTADLQMRFLYEADQTTLSEIQCDLVNDEGDLSRNYVLSQKDHYGNPTIWAVSAPRAPFSPEIISKIDELIPALYIEKASYSYYKQ